MKSKTIVITSINSYENTSIKDFLKYDFNIILVGDKKTNHSSYLNKNVLYIHPTENTKFDKFEKLLPYNHYCRKNIGYLYALLNGSELIFDTDDDNYPLDNFNTWKDEIVYEKITGSKYPNILTLFTNEYIWPRGYPLELLQTEQTIEHNEVSLNDLKNIGIIQSIADGDPDVDAIYRLTNQSYNKDINFISNRGYVIDKNIYVQGNTQATIWNDRKLFHLLYVPCTVSFRFCDILKMYIAQRCMWEYNKLFCYISPIVKQDRNEHDYMLDFKSEYSMYTNILYILESIFDKIKLNGDANDLLLIYIELYKNEIVKEKEIELVEEWLKNIDTIMNK